MGTGGREAGEVVDFGLGATGLRSMQKQVLSQWERWEGERPMARWTVFEENLGVEPWRLWLLPGLTTARGVEWKKGKPGLCCACLVAL